ncbi:MAG: cell wall hydrolase [Sandaracinobacteroides sp.]
MRTLRPALLSAPAILLLAALLLAPAAAARPAPALPEPVSADRGRALACLTVAIAHEAGYEPRAGQEAVAEVILNRVRDPERPGSVCGVVFEGAKRRTGCQFTFTCDGALARRLPATVLAQSRDVAARVLDGLAPSRVAGATHYHANYVSPYWAPSLVRTARIGAHIFYRPAGAGDMAGGAWTPLNEPEIALLKGLQLAAENSWSSTAPTVVATVAEPRAAPPALLAPWGLSTKGP